MYASFPRWLCTMFRASKHLSHSCDIGTCVQCSLYTYQEMFAINETLCELSVSQCEPMSLLLRSEDI